MFASLTLACGEPNDPNGRGDVGSEGTGGTEATAGTETGDEPAGTGGLRFVDVEFNQGVGIALVRGGQKVGLEARTARPVAGRPGLLRAAIAADPSFSPAEVVFTIELERPGQPPLRDERRLRLDTTATSLTGTRLQGVLPAEVLVAGAKLTLSLSTPDGVRLDDAGAQTMDLDVQGGEHVLRVMLAPIRVRRGDCVASPTLTSDAATDVVAKLETELFDLTPADRVEVSVRPEPLEWTGLPGKTTGPSLVEMIAFRREDWVDREVFYYGVFPQCACGIPCDTRPWGNLVGPSLAEAPLRVGLGPDHRLDGLVLAHEIGHMLGRRHVSCPRAPQPPLEEDPSAGDMAADPSYPHPEGRTGAPGYSVSKHLVFRGTFDVMTYCHPAWISDVHWEVLRRYLEDAR